MDKKEDIRIIKTKRNLYDSLLKLMKEKSFEEIKVSDICNLSLTNRSTFYDHFSDKFELLESLLRDLEKELIKKLAENEKIDNSKDYYMEMIKLFFDHIDENSNIYCAILKKNNNSIALDMVNSTLLKDVESFFSQKEVLHTDIPAEIISKFYVSGVISICFDYIKYPKKYQKDKIVAYLDKLLPDKIY